MERAHVGRARRVPSARASWISYAVWNVVLVVGAVAGVAMTTWGVVGVPMAGISVLVTAASGAWALHGPRGAARPELVDGATRVPRRPGHVTALVSASLGFASTCAVATPGILQDPDPARRAGAVVLAVPVFVGYAVGIGVARLLGRGRTTLSTKGLTHTSLVGRTRTLSWRQLHDVHAPTGAGLGLVLDTRDGRAIWNINALSLGADDLAAALRCFAKRPQDRALPARDGALDRWLKPPASA